MDAHTITVSETQRPLFSNPSVHSFGRGPSPWHVDAFPDALKSQAPECGVRQWGCFELDYWGNAIGFVPDGTVMHNHG